MANRLAMLLYEIGGAFLINLSVMQWPTFVVLSRPAHLFFFSASVSFRGLQGAI